MSYGINLFIFLMISGAIFCLDMAIGELRKRIEYLEEKEHKLKSEIHKLKSEIHNIITYLKGESDNAKENE